MTALATLAMRLAAAAPDPLIERYLVSAFLADPALLGDPAAMEFEARDLWNPTAMEVFRQIRNLESAGAPIAAATVIEAIETERAERRGHDTGSKHHPELDELISLAIQVPPTLPAVHRMIRQVQHAAAARRAARESAEEEERIQNERDAAVMDALGDMPPERPDERPLPPTPPRDDIPPTGEEHIPPPREERDPVGTEPLPGASSDDARHPEDAFHVACARALAEIRAALGRGRGPRRRAPIFDRSTDATELLRRTFTRPQWLVSELITRGGTGILGGLPKAAKKTWATAEIAVAVATGTRAFGTFDAAKGRVAYFFAEDTELQVRNRVRSLLAGARRELAPDRLYLRPRGMFIDIMDDEDLATIVASGRGIGQLDLLILDPLRDLHSGEEDKSDSMRDVMRRLRLLGELVGCTVYAVHHAGKPSDANGKRGGGQRLRGSGAIHGSADSGIYILETDGDGMGSFEMTVESEIKGARSAGVFKLALELEDDAQWEAVRATWTVTREDRSAKKPSAKEQNAAARSAQGQDDDRKVFDFVRKLAMAGVHLSRRALRDHDGRPIAVNRMTKAIDRLIEADRLVLADAEVRIPGSARGDES